MQILHLPGVKSPCRPEISNEHLHFTCTSHSSSRLSFKLTPEVAVVFASSHLYRCKAQSHLLNRCCHNTHTHTRTHPCTSALTPPPLPQLKQTLLSSMKCIEKSLAALIYNRSFRGRYYFFLSRISSSLPENCTSSKMQLIFHLYAKCINPPLRHSHFFERMKAWWVSHLSEYKNKEGAGVGHQKEHSERKRAEQSTKKSKSKKSVLCPSSAPSLLHLPIGDINGKGKRLLISCFWRTLALHLILAAQLGKGHSALFFFFFFQWQHSSFQDNAS